MKSKKSKKTNNATTITSTPTGHGRCLVSSPITLLPVGLCFSLGGKLKMNKKIIILSTLYVFICSFAVGAAPSIPNPEIKTDISKPPLLLPDKNAKIIGKWTWTLPNSNCSETYIFQPDGTGSCTSGEENDESIYRISSLPTPKGFFVLSDKITKTNGGKDCSGSVTPVGDEVTMYLSFHQSGDMFIVCNSESFDTCFGPLKRISE